MEDAKEIIENQDPIRWNKISSTGSSRQSIRNIIGCINCQRYETQQPFFPQGEGNAQGNEKQVQAEKERGASRETSVPIGLPIRSSLPDQMTKVIQHRGGRQNKNGRYDVMQKMIRGKTEDGVTGQIVISSRIAL